MRGKEGEDKGEEGLGKTKGNAEWQGEREHLKGMNVSWL